jgi:hypothetical protein
MLKKELSALIGVDPRPEMGFLLAACYVVKIAVGNLRGSRE